MDPGPAPVPREDWLRDAVVYQVYPRSFADSDGDGNGDLGGVIEHLDHLAGSAGSLGVDAIWLSPIYPSPWLDGGYDIADHAGIDPVFGTLADFDRLVAEAHRRGLRVMLDLVMNHTSDRHPWFEASRASRDGPCADWYLWADPSGFDAGGRPLPPNGLRAFFGGSAWEWEPRRGQFWFHIFLPQQPDVNWRNPALREAMWAMVRGWLDRGVDGFRLDVFSAFVKAADLAAPWRAPGLGDGGVPGDLGYGWDRAALAEVLGEFRAVVDAYPGRATVGELFALGLDEAVAAWAPGHLVFEWGLVEAPWSAAAFRRVIAGREAAWGARWPTVVLSNHDRSRHVSRYLRRFRDRSAATADAVARAAATIELTLRGTPFLYAGEEIGALDITVPPERVRDGAALRMPDWWNRDGCRAPMAWDGGPGLGFSTGEPWLPSPPDGEARNVAAQRAEVSSVLAHYRRLLALRRGSAALRRGDLRLADVGDPDVLAYLREGEGEGEGEAILVLVRFGRRGGMVRLPKEPAASGGWEVLLSTHDDAATPEDGRLLLQGFEGVVLRAWGGRR
jgi:glycosidase